MRKENERARACYTSELGNVSLVKVRVGDGGKTDTCDERQGEGKRGGGKVK